MKTILALTVFSLMPLNAADDWVSKLEIPNADLLNQDNQKIHFYDDLIKDKTVAINFIFTSCPTVCPPMGANFAALQKELEAMGQEVSLISVSINPTVDTPARLAAWRNKFGGDSGWELVTGKKAEIDRLLKMLKVFSADINLHAPFVIIGNAREDQWQYLNGLTEPKKLAALLAEIQADATSPKEQGKKTAMAPKSAAEAYFTDIELIDHHGKKQRLYSDLLKGKKVIINSFFASCKGVCIKTMGCFDEIQAWLGDRLGKDVYMLSFSVDPVNDTPEALNAYAKAMEIQPGWLLLTGEKTKVDQALTKIGHYVEARESHSNIFIIGNEKTGLWKKAFGLAGTDAVIDVIKSVLEDRG